MSIFKRSFIYVSLLLSWAVGVKACSDLIITGIIDGPLGGGLPKAFELYAPVDIADLSVYGIETAFNGAAANGQDYTFPAVAVTAGTFLYVSYESPGFTSYFGFAPTYSGHSVAQVNGDDVVLLYKNLAVIDVYGVAGVDGTGETWEYLDSFVYRKNLENPSATFDEAAWTITPKNSLDGETTNAAAAFPFPYGSFTCSSPSPSAAPSVSVVPSAVPSVSTSPSSVPSLSFAPSASCTDLIITGVIDGPLPYGRPKAIELFAPVTIPDLSIYGVGSANNGAASSEEYNFPAVTIIAGTFFYLATETTDFNAYFGFDPTFTDSQATNVNGNDAIELFKNGAVIDAFGVVGQDGDGQPWEYTDSFAYRVEGSDASPTFYISEWTILPPDTLDGETSNDSAAHRFPLESFSCVATPSASPSVSIAPSATPSISIAPSTAPSVSSAPSASPSISISPSSVPSISIAPSAVPSVSSAPSTVPSISISPSAAPSVSVAPSMTPSISIAPSTVPSISTAPSTAPSVSISPSAAPSVSVAPSTTPSVSTAPSAVPSISIAPSDMPSVSASPSATPSVSAAPSASPSTSISPSTSPSLSMIPSAAPSLSQAPSDTPSISNQPTTKSGKTPVVSTKAPVVSTKAPVVVSTKTPVAAPTKAPVVVVTKTPKTSTTKAGKTRAIVRRQLDEYL